MNARMNKQRFFRSILWFLVSVLPGVATFFFLTGGRILNPTFTQWMMVGDDAATPQLGWQFFRHSDLFQWPLGANPDYGMALGSSIVFTDSIPLLAFFFKPLSPLLPDSFQYTGLWILGCCVLQAFFAWKLLSFFTREKILLLAGSCFFTLAPIYLWRIPGHFALAGHWLILAGFCLYFAEKFSILRWTVLLTAATLINPYLLAMVLLIWTADLAQRRFLKELTSPRAAGTFLAGCLTVFFVMWATGHFLSGVSFDETGFGYYRMNLLSLVDSDGIWSRLLRDQKGGGGDYEGFNFLGLGMIGLGFAAGYRFLFTPKRIRYATVIPLAVLSAGLFVYALSNKVAIGGLELFSYNLPAAAGFLLSAFRVSGRFFWPVYYLIFLAILYLVFTRFSRRDAVVMCLFALFIQAVDFTPGWNFIRGSFDYSSSRTTPLQSPAWEDISGQYQNVIMVPPGNAPENWMAWAQFASMHQMSINTGYFARLNSSRIQEEKKRLEASILDSGLKPDSLYVFQDEDFWKLVTGRIKYPDIAGVLDGFRIIAPNLGDCRSCNPDTFRSIAVEKNQPLNPE